jgi:hypothetical protein
VKHGAELPPWLALREGARPIVIVAPHGGRRLRPIRRGDSVNDLHTAEIAWELAERLDAHALVNHGLDRNEIDLNRISHLVERAPGLLALLARSIDAASRGGCVPLVLFVHGWNMVVPCCDVGIGLRRRAGEITGRFPTLSRARFDSTIVAIEEELLARGVSASIGRRYTASGRDNAAQLFSGRHATHENGAVAALAALAIHERVDAAQLELGIPLRWKGPLRDAFVEGLVAGIERAPAAGSQDVSKRNATTIAIPAATGRGTSPPVIAFPSLPGIAEPDASSDAANAALIPRMASGWRLAATSPNDAAAPPEPGYSFQAVLDDEAGIATFCGVEATGPRSMAARFSLVFTDGTMMLLVGEGDWSGERGHYQIEGFDWRATGDGARIEVTLRAPMIRYPTHDAYLDLERGLAGSRLEDADIRLVIETLSADHARLRGSVRTLGITREVDTIAFLDRGGRRATGVEARVRVAVPLAGGSFLLERSRSDETATLEMDESAGALGTIRGLAPAALGEAQVLARVPVWRPLDDGTLVRWTFGLVRCRFEGGSPDVIGLFDCTDVFTP